LPPGEPGGGITGVVAPLFFGGVTIIPGSTFGGVIVPFCGDIRLLRFPSGGAIFSGGGCTAFGGGTGTVGLDGDAAGGFCANAGAAARIDAVKERIRSIMWFRLDLCITRPRFPWLPLFASPSPVRFVIRGLNPGDPHSLACERRFPDQVRVTKRRAICLAEMRISQD